MLDERDQAIGPPIAAAPPRQVLTDYNLIKHWDTRCGSLVPILMTGFVPQRVGRTPMEKYAYIHIYIYRALYI